MFTSFDFVGVCFMYINIKIYILSFIIDYIMMSCKLVAKTFLKLKNLVAACTALTKKGKR